VTYKAKDEYKKVIDAYHKQHYSSDLYQIEYAVGKHNYRVIDYKDGECVRYYIFSLTDSGLVKTSQWYCKGPLNTPTRLQTKNCNFEYGKT